MQLQCGYCSKMFVVSKEAALAGMYAIHNEGQTHFDATVQRVVDAGIFLVGYDIVRDALHAGV